MTSTYELGPDGTTPVSPGDPIVDFTGHPATYVGPYSAADGTFPSGRVIVDRGNDTGQYVTPAEGWGLYVRGDRTPGDAT